MKPIAPSRTLRTSRSAAVATFVSVSATKRVRERAPAAGRVRPSERDWGITVPLWRYMYDCRRLLHPDPTRRVECPIGPSSIQLARI